MNGLVLRSAVVAAPGGPGTAGRPIVARGAGQTADGLGTACAET